MHFDDGRHPKQQYVKDNEKNSEIFPLLSHEKYVAYCSKSSPVTGPEGPRVFQVVKVPRFRDNGTG